MADKNDCALCEATFKTFKKPIPCGGNQDLNRCKYVPKLLKDNRWIWEMYCELSGALDLATVNMFFDWKGLQTDKRMDIWRQLKVIGKTFDKVAKKNKEQEGLGDYAKNAQSVWGGR